MRTAGQYGSTPPTAVNNWRQMAISSAHAATRKPAEAASQAGCSCHSWARSSSHWLPSSKTIKKMATATMSGCSFCKKRIFSAYHESEPLLKLLAGG